MYLEGLGFHSIGRILSVSNVSVLNWIKEFGKKIKDLQSDGKTIEYAELDEMHSFIGNKKTIVGYGLLLIDLKKKFINFFIGDRSNKSAFKFWDKIK